MIDGKTFLAVVPEYGGSKPLPGKTIRPLNDCPLIQYTIEQVEAVNELDCCVISTDDEEISKIVQFLGGSVIKRPEDITSELPSTEFAILHALDVLEKNSLTFDYVTVLDPAFPFRKPETILKFMKQIVAVNGEALMAIRKITNPIGHVVDGVFNTLAHHDCKQEQGSYYIESNAVYIAKVECLQRTKTLIKDGCHTVEVEKEEAINIKTPLDFEIASAIMSTAV